MLRIGWVFYINGYHYLIHLFRGDTSAAQHTNKMLLIGYYFVNIGFAVFSISEWETIDTIQALIQSLTLALGRMIFLLSILHYNNLFWLQFIVKYTSQKQ